MVEALSGWLARIVAVVLLAALVDLLLPNKTMQRYVRLVAGLLVLLTVATPVLSLFKSDFSEKLSADIDATKLSYGTDAGALERIEADGRKLSEARNEQAAKLATAQLSSEIRAAVEEAGLGTVESVDVSTKPDGAGGMRLSRVELTMDAAAPTGDSSDAAGSETDGAPIADVEPVAPVDIRIDPEADEGSSSGSADQPAGASAGTDAEDAALASRVAALLQGRFGVAPDQVVVRQAASASAY